MQSIGYYYSKFVLKVLRGKCIANSLIDKTACVNSGCSVYESSIGRYSYLGYDCEVINTVIGSFCSLASGIHIGLAEHPTDWVSTSPVFQAVKNSSIQKRFAHIALPEKGRTIIGHDVWIGTNAIVKKGVHVGTGAVIASGAVVTKDVEPYAIVGGCPAKVIRYRFSEDIIELLMTSEWWNLDDVKLEEIGMYANNPVAFAQKALEVMVGGGNSLIIRRLSPIKNRTITFKSRRVAA